MSKNLFQIIIILVALASVLSMNVAASGQRHLYIIGYDIAVGSPEENSLKDLAQQNGGTYLSAANATTPDQLKRALTEAYTGNVVPKPVISDTTKSVEIFNNWNIGGVDNSPSCNPSFTISQAHYITYIDTYHWNSGSGTAAGGTIGLRSDVGTEYGPWQTETTPGQGGVPNANWIAHPNETIPAGTYTIIDSDPSTWSQNSGSNGCGFSKVEGYQTQANTALQSGSIWKVKEYGPMGNWDGEWVIRKDAKTIDASWSGGSITDIIDIKSIEGDQVTLYRHGNKGYYTGTISPDGLSMSGTASWYSPGEKWTASTTSPGSPPKPSTPAPETMPVSAFDWYNKGLALKNQSKYDEAINAFDKAIRLDPTDSYYRYFKGSTLYDQGKYDEANQAFDEAIQLKPDSEPAWFVKSLALKSLGRTSEANAALAKAKELGYTG